MTDERLYEIVAAELQAGDLRQGLWLKALHLSEGDEAAARHRYIGLRVDALKQEDRNRRHYERGRRIGEFAAEGSNRILAASGTTVIAVLVVVMAATGIGLLLGGIATLAEAESYRSVEGWVLVVAGVLIGVYLLAWRMSVKRQRPE